MILKSFYKTEGFSLVEALIAVLLVVLLVIGVMKMITNFPLATGKDFVETCLLQAASSGIEAKRANHSLSSLSVPCGNITINVTITGNPPAVPPSAGSGTTACATVVATATYGGRSMVLRDLVCNFAN
ncbi:MAG: hypothetical protein N2511_04965 [Thermodesulfovibrionales bacterium]|nr:hypothetical protein [Thermodesulfovibrionales bacterium]